MTVSSICSFAASTSGKDAKSSDRGRLYHNQGNCTFKDVAAEAGIINEYMAKGSAWGDYDGDGRLDLFVSNMTGPAGSTTTRAMALFAMSAETRSRRTGTQSFVLLLVLGL